MTGRTLSTLWSPALLLLAAPACGEQRAMIPSTARTPGFATGRPTASPRIAPRPRAVLALVNDPEVDFPTLDDDVRLN